MKKRILTYLRKLLGPEPRAWLESPHKDALILQPIAVLDPATNSLTVIDKATGRPIQFVGELDSATWEYASDGNVGALRATLVNPAVYQVATQQGQG